MSKDRYKVLATLPKQPESAYDAVVSPYPLAKGTKDWKEFLTFPPAEQAAVLKFIKRKELKPEAGAIVTFDRSLSQRQSVLLLDAGLSAFRLLGLAKDLVSGLREIKAERILLELHRLPEALALSWLDAFSSALKVAEFTPHRYGKKTPSAAWMPKLDVSPGGKAFKEQLQRSMAESEGTNLVRELAMQAGNDLTPGNYIARLKKEALAEGLGFEFYGVKKLEQLKAGAFLAVVQASSKKDAGIVRLTYKPAAAKSVKHLCLVGKGVTFDTGGTNLKGAQHMWGMHRDMAGSAVAYALVRLAAREKWPMAVTAYLAIRDNLTGDHAYRPNDVVTAMSGRTIEVVHTDAEGRMLLADTLYLASKEEPDLIIDFATLTGAVVGAIGTSYAGAFTNREEVHSVIIESGKASGERVWPFPLDDDFAESLKSDTADTKQCRLSGGVDHIEAAMFLKSFLATDIPWIHIDLAAADRTGGLAHVDTEATGFGVRLGALLARKLLLKS